MSGETSALRPGGNNCESSVRTDRRNGWSGTKRRTHRPVLKAALWTFLREYLSPCSRAEPPSTAEVIQKSMMRCASSRDGFSFEPDP